MRGDALPASDPRLDQVLDSVDFDQVKFADALTWLTDRVGINLIVAWDTLHQAGMDRDAIVTLHLKHVTLTTVLDAVLLSVDVAHTASWNEFGGIVHVTTFEAEPPQHLLLRFYDVQSILQKPALKLTTRPADVDIGMATRLDELKKLITDAVFTTTWKDNGGDVGSISSYPGTLVIIQTAQAHRQIEMILRKLDHQF